jgi:hypothetical protein
MTKIQRDKNNTNLNQELYNILQQRSKTCVGGVCCEYGVWLAKLVECQKSPRKFSVLLNTGPNHYLLIVKMRWVVAKIRVRNNRQIGVEWSVGLVVESVRNIMIQCSLKGVRRRLALGVGCSKSEEILKGKYLMCLVGSLWDGGAEGRQRLPQVLGV